MKMKLNMGVKALFCVVLASCLWVYQVNANNVAPHQIVEDATSALVKAANQYELDAKKGEFNKQVMAALDPIVAFDYIARGVMGKKHYKLATPDQRQAFTNIFKTELVTTYGNGIATYAKSKIVVIPPKNPIGESRKTTVVQEVTHEGSTHKLSYTMGKNKKGVWKLLNVVLNGVNLGRSFNSQFKQLAEKHEDDLDKVIELWDA